MSTRIVIPIVIGGILLIAGGLGVLLWLQLREPPRADLFSDDDFQPGEFTGSAVDSAARIEIERLRAELDAMQEQLSLLRETATRAEVQALEASRTAGAARDAAAAAATAASAAGASTSVVPGPADPVEPSGTSAPMGTIDAYAAVVLIANRRNVNEGLTHASPRYLEGVLGRPRQNLTDDCLPMTNPKLRAMLVTENVGPIRVRMLKPAAESIKRVFERVRQADPDLYARIGTAGSLCVRQIRGSRGRLSSHSFGLSVDLNIDGVLDNFADGRTQVGLTILADFFRNEGWYWGAGFSREDSMHFEASKEMVERWRAEGKL